MCASVLMEMIYCLKYVHTWPWTLELSLGHKPSTLKVPQRAVLTPENSSNSTKLLLVTQDFCVLYKCEAILYHIVSESINSLGFQNQDFRITSSFELIKTLSNNNFSRQVSLVYRGIQIAIFTLLASLPGWEHQHQLYVFILSHSSVSLPCFLPPGTHRAAFLPSGV